MKPIQFLGFTLHYSTRVNEDRLYFVSKCTPPRKDWYTFTSKYNYMIHFENDLNIMRYPMSINLDIPNEALQGEFYRKFYYCYFTHHEFEARTIHALEVKAQKVIKAEILKEEADIAELKKYFQIK